MDPTKSKPQEQYDDLTDRFKAAVQEKAEASLQVAQLQKPLDKANARYAKATSLEDTIKRRILEMS
jgi:predicted  nucleic acid-binding Zn-ribbon protein